MISCDSPGELQLLHLALPAFAVFPLTVKEGQGYDEKGEQQTWTLQSRSETRFVL